ncbi:MAG: ATP-binding protein [Robiginitomaculum sp.]|nr:ATP-binding protein [Robiginitomaculum sp.]
MIGMTDLLLEMPQSDEQKRLTSSANTAGRHLLGLVNDILDFSKLDAGKLVVEQTPFALESEIMVVHDMLISSAQEKGLALKLELEDNIKGSYIGDPSRIRQILVNLISNAIKFTSKGQVSICIDKAKGQRVRFCVTDTGTGIDEKVLPTLFSDFSQADSSITRKFGGTGLGLAICKRLTDVMGGEIGANSILGQGSEFWFEIPLERTNDIQINPTDQEAATKAKPTKEWRLNVLVAEDNPANQLLIKTIMKRMGHTLVMANNGLEAVEAALAEKFDLILMDVQMPKLDGVSATRRLREAGCDTPVIALTAHILADEKSRFSAAGMDAWVSKPFDARKLAETMYYWAQKGPQPHMLEEQKTG